MPGAAAACICAAIATPDGSWPTKPSPKARSSARTRKRLMTDPSMDQDIGPLSAIAKRDRSERDATACRAPRPEAPARELTCRISPNRGRRAMLFRGFGLSLALALTGVFGLPHLHAGQSGDLVPKLEG